MGKLMDLFLQNILANSITMGVAVAVITYFVKKAFKDVLHQWSIVKVRVGNTEDKMEAFIQTILNGNYSEFEKHYNRLKAERKDKEK